MKNYGILFLLLASCSQPMKEERSINNGDMSESAPREIWETDVSMIDLAVKEGFQKTLIDFADDSME